MDIAKPEFVPNPDQSRQSMEELQREIATEARFEDVHGLDEATLSTQIVVGVDQAFLEDRVVSVLVATCEGEVVDRVAAVSPLSIPYIPGLLAFREGLPIIDAARELDVEPDLLLFDGSGRIHYRQAGLATHMGVIFDVLSIGVAKSLLCGSPVRTTEDLAVGDRVPIEADNSVEATTGTVLGVALQTRQFDSPNRHINPVFVSPGHRVDVETSADLVESQCQGYKLPEPIRLADVYADEQKKELAP